MTAKDNRWLLVILVFSGIISYYIRNLCFSNYTYDALIAFLSIITGFTLTAFSSIFSSKIVQKLFNIKDDENPSITLKHRLKNYFLFAFDGSLSSIIFLLIAPTKIYINTPKINFFIYKDFFILPIISFNIFIYYKITRYFSKIFIKEGISNE